MSANSIRISPEGDPVYIAIEGLEDVQNELNTLAADIKAQASLEMVTRVGEKVQYWMQQNILSQGLLKSGNLFNSITVTPVTNDEGAFVYVGPDGSVPYAYIQNYGGTVPAHWVFPVSAKALHWQEDGKDRFSKGHIVGIKKPIVIQARPYIEPAYDDHADEIIDTMMEVLDAAIAAGCASL